MYVRDGIHLNKRGASIGAHCFLHWNKSNTTSRHTKKKTKNLCYIPLRTGILLINAAGVVISWGILSCPPVSGCVYAISIVVIEECQKYFITRSAVIPVLTLCLLSRHICMINAAKGCLCANHVLPLCFMKENTYLATYFVYLMTFC